MVASPKAFRDMISAFWRRSRKMYGNKQGRWIDFSLRDPSAKIARLSISCISTSAESAGHFTTVLSTGKIVGINDTVTTLPQTSQEIRAQEKV